MATISFTTQFNLTATPKVFVFTDTSNYAGQGISTSNVNGCFKITSPSGIVIYNNVDYSNGGCDIRVSASTQNQTSISLPLLLGVVEPGAYTILYTVKDITASPVFYTITNAYTYSYVAPTIVITQTINLVSPLFISTDSTSYPISGATYSLTRVHTLNYPIGSAGAGSPTVSSLQTIPVSVFYNGTQTTQITSTLTYTFSDGLVVYDIVTGSEEILVNDYDVCSMSCCIKSMEELLSGYKLTDQALYNALLPQFNLVMAYVGLINLSIQCGLVDNIPAYITKIQELSHCTDACSGCSEEGSQVVGAGFTNLTVDVVEGTGIDVSSSIVGDTTTYTVSLGSAWITLINSLYNTVLTAGYGITVSASGIISNVQTYTIKSTLVATRSSSVTPFTVSAASGIIVTGCTVTAPTTGTYLISAEADANVTGANLVFAYRILKNGTTAINADRAAVAVGLSADALPFKVYTNTDPVSLIAGDTLVIQVDSTNTGVTIVGRSITLLMIS